MNRTEWLIARKLGIGSSDAAAICGLSKYRTALDVYADKVSPLVNDNETEVMYWGKVLEDMIAKEYTKRTGEALVDCTNVILRHNEYPFMMATLDRTKSDGTPVEIKTASAYVAGEWGESGSDQIPESYMIQVQHQLMVADKPMADVAVLIGGNNFRVYHIERDQGVIDELIRIEKVFWDQVMNKTPPAPDYSHPTTIALLNRLYGGNNGMTIDIVDPAFHQACQEFDRMRDEIKQCQQKQDEAKAKILDTMKENGVGVCAGFMVTRATQKRKGYTVEPTEITTLRIKKL